MKKLNKTENLLSIYSTNPSNTTKSKLSGAQLDAIENFVKRTLKRLENFNRLLDLKIEQTNLVSEMKTNGLSRSIDVSYIETYKDQKVKDKNKKGQLGKAKLVIEMITKLIMSISLLMIIKTLKSILMTQIRRLILAKNKKEKSKRKKLQNKNKLLH